MRESKSADGLGATPVGAAKAQLLAAARVHVPFDGWSETTFLAAVEDCGMDQAVAREACPRGAVDLAIACHAAGDADMLEALGSSDLDGLRVRDKIARAVWLRIGAIGDREVARRGAALFALPHLVADGAALAWRTADAIWNAIGDRSEDYNWYTKRGILAGVYSATALYWLGDDSSGWQATREFLDRRIDGVMRFEKAKARARETPALRPLAGGLGRALSGIRRPARQSAE